MAASRENEVARQLLDFGAVAVPMQADAPQAVGRLLRIDRFMPRQHTAAMTLDQITEPFARRANQRAGVDQRRADRIVSISGDGASGGMIDQRRKLGMRIVLNLREERRGRAIRSNRIVTEPSAAERTVALDDDQPPREFGEQPALRCRGQQGRAGRAAADDQHIGDGGRTRPRRCVRLGGMIGADSLHHIGDHVGIGGRHRVGDRQRQHPAANGVGHRRRLDQ